jgi:hypothetical protein
MEKSSRVFFLGRASVSASPVWLDDADAGHRALYDTRSQCEAPFEHLTTATTMYREMGMKYWLEQAEAELRVR